MTPQHANLLFAVWLGVQALGIAVTVAARYSSGARQRRCQLSYFFCLLLVGLTAVVWAGISPSACLVSGATLSIMVVGAVWDSDPYHASV